MSKYIRTVISLILLAAAIGTAAAQDAAICEALRVIHATHGDSLSAYLSEKGEDCLEPTGAQTPIPTAMPEPLNEEIWSASGSGSSDRPLTLELTRGVYEFEAERRAAGSSGGWAQLDDIIDRPDCLSLNHVTFPATVILRRNCRIHATLAVQTPLFQDRKRWEVSIRKVSDDVPLASDADGWSLSGFGYSHQPVEILFERGIYRIIKRTGPDVALLGIPTGQNISCLDRRIYEIPTQFEVRGRCHFRGGIKVGNTYGEVGSWSYSITKLD